MASKWAKIKGKYPDQPREEVMVKAVEEMMGLTPAEIVDKINVHKDRLAELASEEATLKFEVEAGEKALLAKMEEIGTDRLNIGGYSWSATFEPYPQIVDRAALRAWMEENEPDMLSVNPQTLKGLTKEALEHEKELPSGVDVFVKAGISRRKRG